MPSSHGSHRREAMTCRVADIAVAQAERVCRPIELSAVPCSVRPFLAAHVRPNGRDWPGCSIASVLSCASAEAPASSSPLEKSTPRRPFPLCGVLRQSRSPRAVREFFTTQRRGFRDVSCEHPGHLGPRGRPPMHSHQGPAHPGAWTVASSSPSGRFNATVRMARIRISTHELALRNCENHSNIVELWICGGRLAFR